MYPIFVVNLGLHTQTSKDLGDNRSREHALLNIIIIIIKIVIIIIFNHHHRGYGFGEEIFFPLKEVLQDQRQGESKGLGHVHLLPRTAQVGRMEKLSPQKSLS